jgi:hypothetical protein
MSERDAPRRATLAAVEVSEPSVSVLTVALLLVAVLFGTLTLAFLLLVKREDRSKRAR